MSDELLIQDSEVVRSALDNDRLVPPAAPETLGSGSTAELRDAMARFSSGEAHGERRAAVVAAIEQLEALSIEEIAASWTRRRLVGDDLDGLSILGRVVPSKTLCEALSLSVGPSDQMVSDIELIAEAIGRGEVATSAHDAAVDRLRSELEGRSEDVVAIVSVLYQNFDATAALFASTIMSGGLDAGRRSSVANTVREAVADTTVGDNQVPAGETVALSLDSLELEFGAGPHQCPGERLAKRIVNGMLQAITDAGYELVHDDVETDHDGRATVLPLSRLAPGT